MKYKLYSNEQINSIDDLLRVRGIENVEEWKNASWEQINNPSAFGEDIYRGVEFIRDALRNKQKICVIVDCDCDGWTASAIALNYLYKLYSWNLNKQECEELLTYYIHDGKEHGLSDCYQNLPPDAKLIWVPDAGTSNIEEMKYLVNRGKKIIVTD